MSDVLPSRETSQRVLLGVPLDPVTNDEALERCVEAAGSVEPLFFATANLDFATQAEGDADLRRMLFTADLVVADGMPLIWASRWLRGPLPERVAGSDLVPRLLERCAQEGLAVYFFGSDDETLAESSRLLCERYAGLRIAGYESPPMGNMGHWDNAAIAARVRESGARVLLVALGCPKQERWIFGNLAETGVGLAIGIGASLDFVSGKQIRAPRWMQTTGLEWVWRMGTNPKRLAGRYWKDFRFLARAFRRQRAGWVEARELAGERGAGNAAMPEGIPGVEVLAFEGIEGWHFRGGEGKGVLLDLSHAGALDCIDLGRIAEVFRGCRRAGRALAVWSPSRAARAAMEGALLVGVFPVFETVEAVSEWAADLVDAGEDRVQAEGGDAGEVVILLNGPFDVTTFDAMMAQIEAAIPAAGVLDRVVLDLSAVTFLDSRAVGGLLRLGRGLRAERDADLVLRHPSGDVAGTVRLMRLNEVLVVEDGA